ncbi:SDR family oxidoreductase [Reichenbachiella carrageenanivorans]|uniref:SDR family oxidoreductase n=1 Tax=Reichenbachiella carrageenanivorans TaxID=2979869 RepID=A0ABY6CZG6_9BACT|nr:SDR family oxidoreductase [Reichenbachiella carrageenanivorans]UXX78814.1 SDR family oxidoreductase [Reichenbachiella carrageenanivorans]
MPNKQTAIITGGTSGIGKACAELYASKGYNIVITGRNQERLNSIIQSFHADGHQALGIQADAASESGAQDVVGQTIKTFGSIDLLICNAGVSMRAMFEDLDLKVFREVMDINFMGTVNYVKYALPHLLTSKGTIIGISSINGHRGTPARTAYSSSKFAMEGFFEALRTELLYRGVHILVASPGYTGTNIRNTALTAHGEVQGESPKDESKMMTAEEVALRIYKGHQKKTRHFILTPLGWWLNFLNQFVPRLMDKIVYNVLAKEPDSPLKDKPS